MRPLLIAVLLLSCASDEARRAGDAPAAAKPREPAPPTAAAVAIAREPDPPPPDPRIATRKAAHDVLAENCGACHEGHRSTTPKALAVFDLDLPDWPTRFDAHRFASALGRLAKKGDAARAAFVAFRDAELAAGPGAAGAPAAATATN